MTEQLIPCLKPETCGVKNHRPGTYAKCKAGGSGNKNPYAGMPGGGPKSRLGQTPQLATLPKPEAPLSDYEYTPTKSRYKKYDDDNWVPVTDLAIEAASDAGAEITPDGEYAFEYQGFDMMRDEEEVTFRVESKRHRVFITTKAEDGDWQDYGDLDIYDRKEARDWMSGLLDETSM